MLQGFKSSHFTNGASHPAGGTTSGTGFTIGWQHGPLGRGDDRKEPNGAFVEDVIAAAQDRLRFYEKSAFSCPENREAMMLLDRALGVLNSRTEEREARGVEGTHAV